MALCVVNETTGLHERRRAERGARKRDSKSIRSNKQKEREIDGRNTITSIQMGVNGRNDQDGSWCKPSTFQQQKAKV